jgi:hypothetical protein
MQQQLVSWHLVVRFAGCGISWCVNAFDSQVKDEEYVNNREQNIADAIDLLPCLTTGIDVNVMFRKCVRVLTC